MKLLITLTCHKVKWKEYLVRQLKSKVWSNTFKWSGTDSQRFWSGDQVLWKVSIACSQCRSNYVIPLNRSHKREDLAVNSNISTHHCTTDADFINKLVLLLIVCCKERSVHTWPPTTLTHIKLSDILCTHKHSRFQLFKQCLNEGHDY